MPALWTSNSSLELVSKLESEGEVEGEGEAEAEVAYHVQVACKSRTPSADWVAVAAKSSLLAIFPMQATQGGGGWSTAAQQPISCTREMPTPGLVLASPVLR